MHGGKGPPSIPAYMYRGQWSRSQPYADPTVVPFYWGLGARPALKGPPRAPRYDVTPMQRANLFRHLERERSRTNYRPNPQQISLLLQALTARRRQA
jgi:hypothetical protein